MTLPAGVKAAGSTVYMLGDMDGGRF
jgi:hypothetical protein